MPSAARISNNGHFLPTVAGSLVASRGAAVVGQQRLAEVLLGSGVMSWIVVGSLIVGRLFFRPLLPPALRPTMAMEVAAVTALVGGIAVRTVIAISRHQLLPHQPAAPTAEPVSLTR